jgi:hypothetical protein
VSDSFPGVVFCTVARCRPSKRKVKRVGSSTSNLKRHIEDHHPSLLPPPHDSTPKLTQSVRTLLINQADISGVRPCSPKKKTKFNQSILRLIISNCLSFNVVDSPEFIHSLHLISGGSYIPASRNTLVPMIDSLYHSMVDVLLADLNNNSVSITTDAATLNGGASYITVTAHYITEDFVMRDVVLMVAQMTESHTGEYVSELLDRVVESFRLENRVFAAVSDNGANFVKGIRINKNVGEQWRCMMHTLQLSLHDAVAEFDELHALCRDVQGLVSRIRNTHLLTEELLNLQVEEAAVLLVPASGSSSPLSAPPLPVTPVRPASSPLSPFYSVPPFSSSPSSSFSFSSSSSSSPSSSSSSPSSSLFTSSPSFETSCSAPRRPLRLLTDAPTRFNSFCLVFTRLLEVKAAVIKLCADHPAQLGQLALSTDQWLLVSEVLLVLTPVKEVCDALEATLTPSLSFLVPLLCRLLVTLQTTAVQDNATPLRRQVANFVAGNIYTRVHEAMESETAQVGMMLDPRVRTRKLPQFDKKVVVTALRDAYRRFGEALGEMRGACVRLRRPVPVNQDSKEEREEKEEKEEADVRVEEPPPKRVRGLMDWEEEAQPAPVSELEAYLNEPGIDHKHCPLKWWREKRSVYPTLFEMARVYLAIPASSAASERVFSAAKLILDHKRRSLTPDRVSRLIFLKKNLPLFDQLKSTDVDTTV